MPDKVIYEQPLNERTRGLLRLEHLFDIVNARIDGPSEWDSRAVVTGLVDITDLLNRSDIKTELIKELERQAAALARLEQNPQVDGARLRATLDEIGSLVAGLKDPGWQPGASLRQDELVVSVRQRLTIPGGTCNFDVPAFHCWLNRPLEQRLRQLRLWCEDMQILERGTQMALNLIRSSAEPQTAVAVRGFYQQPMDSNIACQLIRVLLPDDSPLFPEVSGGRHRFTVRFLEQPSTSARPTQTDQDVAFELHCCVL